MQVFYLILPVWEFTNFRKPTIFENAATQNYLLYQLLNHVQGKRGKRWSTSALKGVNSYALSF